MADGDDTEPGFHPSGEHGDTTSGEDTSRNIVGGYSTRYSGYSVAGPLEDWYGFAQDPRNRTAVNTTFRPYRERDVSRILGRKVNQGTVYDLQMSLIAAGLLADDVGFGYVDDATEQAFSSLLSIANQNGIAWQDVLSQAVAGGGTLGGEGAGGREPLGGTVITLPNRDDMIARVDDLAFTKTGVKLDDDLQEAAADAALDAMRTQQERQVQLELGVAGDDPSSVTFAESAPNADRLLEEEIERRAPGEVMEKGVRDTMDSWFSALRGPV